MPDIESYNREKRARARRYSLMFQTDSGKRFIKEEMLGYQQTAIDADTDWLRGVQEGERRLAQVIINLSNYEEKIDE